MYEIDYLNIMSFILEHGEWRDTRNGRRKTIFGASLRCHLDSEIDEFGVVTFHEFPLLTTKRVFFRGIVEELRWFLSGSTNIRSLQAVNVHIWDKWADERGNVGPLYGYQWRHWEGGRVDQLAEVLQSIRENPYSARHIVTAWNPTDVKGGGLPPCHYSYQFDCTASGELNLVVNQRSADWFLGVPFNIASYAMLLGIFSSLTGRQPGVLLMHFANVHLYENQINTAKEQLTRPRKMGFPLPPRLTLSARDGFFFDVQLHDYHPLPAIKVEVVA